MGCVDVDLPALAQHGIQVGIESFRYTSSVGAISTSSRIHSSFDANDLKSAIKASSLDLWNT